MRRLVMTLAVLTALAAPSVAQAHAKPYLSFGRAGAAIRAADPHIAMGACTRLGRTAVTCEYSEPAIYVGIETDDPAAAWRSWATVTLVHRGVRVAWAS